MTLFVRFVTLHLSQARPVAPSLHSHCPVTSLHWVFLLTVPLVSHPHAGEMSVDLKNKSAAKDRRVRTVVNIYKARPARAEKLILMSMKIRVENMTMRATSKFCQSAQFFKFFFFTDRHSFYLFLFM